MQPQHRRLLRKLDPFAAQSALICGVALVPALVPSAIEVFQDSYWIVIVALLMEESK